MAGMANKDASIVDEGEETNGAGVVVVVVVEVVETMGTGDEDNTRCGVSVGDVDDDEIKVNDELVDVVVLSASMVVPVVLVVLVELVFKLDSVITGIVVGGAGVDIGDNFDGKGDTEMVCVDDGVDCNGVAIMLHLKVWHSSIRIVDELQFSRGIVLFPL